MLNKKNYFLKALLACLLIFAMMLPIVSCVSDTESEAANSNETTTDPSASEIEPDTTTGEPSDSEKDPGTTTGEPAISETDPFSDTTANDSDQTPTEKDVLKSEPPKSLKILAIGNSFSTDSMQYLYQIAKSAGVEEIVLGNLYYGGCSLDEHYSFGKSDSGSYTYYKNTSGSWSETKNYKMSNAVKDEDWDYISLQQTSKTCGLPSSYSKLNAIVSIVRSYNTTAKLIWNMTWAYQQDSTHSSFPNYNNNQMTMYNMTINAVKKCIDPEIFDIIIPCGTSIQNARTSFMGDTLTRDGHHLDLTIGRYIAGLTWFAAITDSPIDNIVYNPSSSTITDDMMAAAKEAVVNSIKKPYEVTQSTYTEGKRPDVGEDIDPSVVLNPADFFESDTVTAAGYGVDLSKYTMLEWDYLENTYWNCTSKAGTTTPTSGSTFKQNVCSAKKYNLSELPVGTIFILDFGWQYRLEIYTQENAKYTGSRPGLSTETYFVLTEEFLNGCKYIAWNISSSPKKDISNRYQQASCRLRIYIPNAQ